MTCSSDASSTVPSSLLSLIRGDDQDVGINVTNPDGSPYNLSGTVLTFSARQNTYNSTLLLQKLLSGGAANATGLTTLSFVPSDTSGLGDSLYYFDIKLLTTGLKTTTLTYGQLSLYPK